MPKHHAPPTWSQPALIPPEFVRLEIWMTWHGASDSVSVSYKVYDPDSGEWIASEVIPILSRWDAVIVSQRMLEEGTVIAQRHVGPF